MGNSNETKSKKIQEKEKDNEVDDSEEQYYMNIIKNLNINLDKIKNNLKKYNKNDEFVVLIESGSLAPPHKMHIGLMELTKTFIEKEQKKKVIGGFVIPSSNAYVKYKLKKDFINLKHRVNMTKLMIKDSDWLECLDWGFSYGEKIKKVLEKIIKKEFPEYNIKSFLVFGIDYYIRNKMYLNDEYICIFRPGYDMDVVKKMYPKNLIFIEGSNEDISSSKIRKAFRENDEKTILEMTSKEIFDYLKNNNIFKNN